MTSSEAKHQVWFICVLPAKDRLGSDIAATPPDSLAICTQGHPSIHKYEGKLWAEVWTTIDASYVACATALLAPSNTQVTLFSLVSWLVATCELHNIPLSEDNTGQRSVHDAQALQTTCMHICTTWPTHQGKAWPRCPGNLKPAKAPKPFLVAAWILVCLLWPCIRSHVNSAAHNTAANAMRTFW